MNFEYPVIKLSKIPKELLDYIYDLIIGGIAVTDVYLCIMVGKNGINFLSLSKFSNRIDFEITLNEFTKTVKYNAISPTIAIEYVKELIEEYNNK